MILKPKIGIDEIKFGMSQANIIKILGEPNRKRLDFDDDNSLIWEFNDLRIRLTFYNNEDNRFGYFRSMNPNLVFNENKIINSKIEFAKKEIFGKIIDEWEIDEYDFLTTHFNEEYWLTLHEEYGVVTDIEMGIPFKNDEEYNWPE